jgi:hypothetical protein
VCDGHLDQRAPKSKESEMWFSSVSTVIATPVVEMKDGCTQTDPQVGSQWFPLFVLVLSACVVSALP